MLLLVALTLSSHSLILIDYVEEDGDSYEHNDGEHAEDECEHALEAYYGVH